MKRSFRSTIYCLLIGGWVLLLGQSPAPVRAGQAITGSTNPQAAAGTCPAFENTPNFTIAYGTAVQGAAAAPFGSVVTAVSPRGDTVGCFVVSTAGYYGAIYLYGEDNSVSPAVPGMRSGETVRFKINGFDATASPGLTWANDKDFHQVNLSGETIRVIYLPLIAR